MTSSNGTWCWKQLTRHIASVNGWLPSRVTVQCYESASSSIGDQSSEMLFKNLVLWDHWPRLHSWPFQPVLPKHFKRSIFSSLALSDPVLVKLLLNWSDIFFICWHKVNYWCKVSILVQCKYSIWWRRDANPTHIMVYIVSKWAIWLGVRDNYALHLQHALAPSLYCVL